MGSQVASAIDVTIISVPCLRVLTQAERRSWTTKCCGGYQEGSGSRQGPRSHCRHREANAEVISIACKLEPAVSVRLPGDQFGSLVDKLVEGVLLKVIVEHQLYVQTIDKVIWPMTYSVGSGLTPENGLDRRERKTSHQGALPRYFSQLHSHSLQSGS